jgi:hypothetical protein
MLQNEDCRLAVVHAKVEPILAACSTVLDDATGTVTAAFIALVAYVGCRCHDIQHLRVRDVLDATAAELLVLRRA